MSKKIANIFDKVVRVDNHEIPLRIYLEARNSVRVSIGKDTVLLRVPTFEHPRIEKHINYATQWLLTLNKERPEIIAKYHIEKYADNYSLTVLGRYEYTVFVEEQNRSNGTVERHSGNHLKVFIPETLPSFEKKVYIRTLLSKIISANYKKYVVDKVQYWNIMHFQKPINRITLKYNSTNWGSCSVNNNINLSTRTLLLPEPMLDYVIVHELSHLVEMNHSSRFWNTVENVMPDYKSREDWIAKNSKFIDF